MITSTVACHPLPRLCENRVKTRMRGEQIVPLTTDSVVPPNMLKRAKDVRVRDEKMGAARPHRALKDTANSRRRYAMISLQLVAGRIQSSP